MNRYIIIGAGIAGTEAAAAVLERDVEARVDLLKSLMIFPRRDPLNRSRFFPPRGCISIPKQPLNRPIPLKSGFSPPGKSILTTN